MPLEIGFSVERIVMQPTSLCNLNCSYYLPDRTKNAPVAVAIAERVAEGIEQLKHQVELVWHAGEPLSCGISHFSTLIAPFEELRQRKMITHAIQTNGMLIDERWSELFLTHRFRVGVSLDGPPWANRRRTGWDGRPAFENIMRGIACLKKAAVPFHVIAVVSRGHLNKAKGLYSFFADLGCTGVGFNIEEQLGTYRIGFSADEDSAVLEFWKMLFDEWQRNPIVTVREFARVLPSLTGLCDGEQNPPRIYDLFPSVAHNGNVVLLAPEFLNTKASSYNDFVVGNVLDEDFSNIVARGQQSLYVDDFKRGIARCRTECEYFATCYGGQPGNKFFELGTLNSTETAFCRNSEKRVADAILCELVSQKKGGITHHVT